MTPEERTVRAFRQRWAFDGLYKTPAARTISGRDDLHMCAAEHLGLQAEITYLEFGVYAGDTIRKWASKCTNPRSQFFGFDSFLGLPEVWDVGFREFKRGFFSTNGAAPASNDMRVTFVKGWFQNTLAAFLLERVSAPAAATMVHFDADLYSSTLFVLSTLWHHIPDYYFIMDDFSQDDAVALHDFSKAFPVEIEWLADVAGGRDLPKHVFGRMRRVPFALEREQRQEFSNDAVGSRGGQIASATESARFQGSDQSAHDLMLSFESLGSDCEFGLVQRNFRAEPLGLFRWANIQPEVLTSLLDSKFAGFVEPETLRLDRSPWNEYFLRDLKHGTNFHTWKKQIDTDETAFFNTHCVRLRWLRDKLMEDLATSTKLFIYKVPKTVTSVDVLSRLAAAVRNYGKNYILCVEEAADGVLSGKIEQHDSGLMISRLSRFGYNPSTQKWEIRFDEWETICCQAVALVSNPRLS